MRIRQESVQKKCNDIIEKIIFELLDILPGINSAYLKTFDKFKGDVDCDKKLKKAKKKLLKVITDSQQRILDENID